MQTVEIRVLAAVDVMVGVLLVKHALEAEDHVVGIQLAGRFEPVGGLERHVFAQVKPVSGPVIQHFPALRQFGDQPVGVRIDVQQAVIKLCGQGIDRQAAAGHLRVEGVQYAADAIDKAALADVRQWRCRGGRRGCGGQSAAGKAAQ
ncbi:hypothetical protein D3C71_1313830 [compost metagenome]